MRSIRGKILLSFMLTASLFIIGSGAYSAVNLLSLHRQEMVNIRSMLFEDYDKLIRSEVETAVQLIDYFYENYKTGILSEKEAQEAAKDMIRGLRYNGDGYFWIDDTSGSLVVHAIEPEKEGTDRLNLSDPNGVMLIQEILKAAEEGQNEGFTNFMWVKPDDTQSGRQSPKRAYSQLFEPWGWVVSTGNYVDNIENEVLSRSADMGRSRQTNIFVLGIYSLVSILATGLVGAFLSRKLSAPIIKLVKAFEKDSRGQIHVQEIKLKSRDEIGILAETLNQLSQQIKGFVSGVAGETNRIEASAEGVSKHMKVLNEQIEEVSATTQELSAGMEQTAASTEEMNATANDILSAVESIAGTSREGKLSVSELSRRAARIQTDLNEAIQSGAVMLDEVKVSLDKALVESQSVTQINALAEIILQITGQTNLLALNAAIEAARAGDAGRGFAEVADEIRVLAENSKSTAAKIQNVIKIVNDSVGNLSDNSSHLLRFIAVDVKEKYEMMIRATEEYNRDAGNLEKLITGLSETCDELKNAMTGMLRAIDEITRANGEEAEGTNDIAQRVALVKDKSDQLLDFANESRSFAEMLKTHVAKFSISEA